MDRFNVSVSPISSFCILMLAYILLSCCFVISNHSTVIIFLPRICRLYSSVPFCVVVSNTMDMILLRFYNNSFLFFNHNSLFMPKPWLSFKIISSAFSLFEGDDSFKPLVWLLFYLFLSSSILFCFHLTHHLCSSF